MVSVYTTIKNGIEQKASISIILCIASNRAHAIVKWMEIPLPRWMWMVLCVHIECSYIFMHVLVFMDVCVCAVYVQNGRPNERASEWVSLRTLHWTIDKTSNKYIKTEYYWCKPNLTFFPIQIMPYESSAYCKQKKERLEENSFGKSGIFNTRAWNMNVFIYLFKSIVDNHGLSQTTNSI